MRRVWYDVWGPDGRHTPSVAEVEVEESTDQLDAFRKAHRHLTETKSATFYTYRQSGRMYGYLVREVEGKNVLALRHIQELDTRRALTKGA